MVQLKAATYIVFGPLRCHRLQIRIFASLKLSSCSGVIYSTLWSTFTVKHLHEVQGKECINKLVGHAYIFELKDKIIRANLSLFLYSPKNTCLRTFNILLIAFVENAETYSMQDCIGPFKEQWKKT